MAVTVTWCYRLLQAATVTGCYRLRHAATVTGCYRLPHAATVTGCYTQLHADTDIQPFSQKPRTQTVAPLLQIGLHGVAEADLQQSACEVFERTAVGCYRVLLLRAATGCYRVVPAAGCYCYECYRVLQGATACY